MFLNICEVFYIKWCVEQLSKSSQWLGIGVGNSLQISFIFGTQIAYLKQEFTRTEISTNLTPTLTSLRPTCFLDGALKRLTLSNCSPCLIVGLLFAWWIKEELRLASKELKWHLKVHHTGSQSLTPRSLRQAAGDRVSGWVLFEYLGLSVNTLGKGQEQ